MRIRTLIDRGGGGRLTRQFALLSLVIVALITAALSWVISQVLRADLLDREWSLTADYVRTEALQRLHPTDFVTPSDAASQRSFREFYEQAVMMPEIVRVKVYDARMTVVWSDEQRLIGQRFPDNPHLVGALAGQTTVNLETGRDGKDENLYERAELPGLVEVYVPIAFPGSRDVVGVVETYKQPSHVFANIRRGRWVVAGTATAGGVFLYASLFWIVRRAARRIDLQHQRLVSTNDELRQVQGQLVAVERMAAIGEVVTAVAHGIRNPLANIRAAAQVAALDCRAPDNPSAMGRTLANIVTEVDRLEARLKELLQLVRPAERRNEAVDLNTVVRGALELTASRLTEAGVVVDEHLAPELGRLLGDAPLLEQGLMGLIENAAQAMEDGGGTLTITTGTAGEGDRRRAFVEVCDTGPGIPASDLGRIFEPFFTTKAQGTGLGLAMARKFVEAHGGFITAGNQPSGGAIFRVMLPIMGEA